MPIREVATESMPMPSATLGRFLARSPCPYAVRARIVEGGCWPAPDPTPTALDVLAHRLRLLTSEDRWDLAALEIHAAGRLEPVRSAAALVHALLQGLRDRDMASDASLVAGIEDPSWDFEFNGAKFFVSLFAPSYPPEHSRFSGEADVAFVLFQPEGGFRRFGVSSRRPGRRRLSQRVHHRFEREGQWYDLDFNVSSLKALRYVKPARRGDPPVAWWTVPIE